MKFIKNSLYLD